ncbi:GMC family oxidoreductase [Puniceicoccaceae bacterium K14]|nr:GMC family oxidoreductase [Puniceicoccaceae bacterium K14]
MQYDVIIIGSGFASMFFLQGLLDKKNSPKRILIIEKGANEPHFERLAKRRFIQWSETSTQTITNNTPEKPWTYSIAYGGGSNCWFGSTPRILPNGFKTKTDFGIGQDWPIDYNTLEQYYTKAEGILEVSGGETPYPKSAPYPLPAHRLSEPDEILREAYPEYYFSLPTARASRPSKRPQCCGNGVCFLCPIDSKFTIENGMRYVRDDSRIEVVYNASVKNISHSQGIANGVSATMKDGSEKYFSGDIIALGANAIFNPWILLKSGIKTPQTGKGLCEQAGAAINVKLKGLKNKQGSTVTTGWGVKDLFSNDRSQRSGFMFNTVNRPMNIQLDPNSPFSHLEIIASIEDFRQERNKVTFDDSDKPQIEFHGHSEFAEKTFKRIEELVGELIEPLPIESIKFSHRRTTESHIQCTTPMGESPDSSVADKYCKHHNFSNLYVLGSGNFPTASPENPTLTICALSLYAADNI